MKKLINYIGSHFLLRNILMAICVTIIFIFLLNYALNYYTRHGEKIILDDFTGMSIDNAIQKANIQGLEIVIIDSLYLPNRATGIVLDQSPNVNMSVKSGRKIFVVINALRPRTENIPYVIGYSLRQAKNIIENKGFEIEHINYKSDIATNNVLEQSYKKQPIEKGSTLKAELGEGITLTVGRNHTSPLPMIPKVIGLSLREAKSRLWELGLNIGDIRADNSVLDDYYDKAKVYRQVPNQQMRANYGAKVKLYLTNDLEQLALGSIQSDEQAITVVEGDN